jgi:hypothetical protein
LMGESPAETVAQAEAPLDQAVVPNPPPVTEYLQAIYQKALLQDDESTLDGLPEAPDCDQPIS